MQEDVFPVEMRDVGRPTYLIVRSDGSSKKPTWHLDMVIVECSLVRVGVVRGRVGHVAHRTLQLVNTTLGV